MPQASLATKPEEDLRKATPRCFALHRLIYFDLQLARQCLDALCKGQAHLSNNRVAPEVTLVSHSLLAYLTLCSQNSLSD